MKTKRLKGREMPRYTMPVRSPVKIPACEGCGAFTPECVVPNGAGTLALCWLCAHAYVDHQCELSKCAVHECECLPEAIYPESVIKRRGPCEPITPATRDLARRERASNTKSR